LTLRIQLVYGSNDSPGSFPSHDGEATPDYSSIIAEFSGTREKIDPDFIAKFVSDFNLELFQPVWSRELFFFFVKGGPLGNPVLTAMPGVQYFKSVLMKYRNILNWK